MNDHRDLMAAFGFALDETRDILDASDVGNRGAAELHDDPGHGS
jgi:hypothetical protein